MPVEERKGQEGSRWYNERPSGEAVGEWFKKNVNIDEALKHDHYVTGITLISGVEKEKQTVGFNENNGKPIIDEVENVTYTPYIKVETRVKYFHDLMAAHPDWIGFIDPVVPEEPQKGLPPGFFSMKVAQSKGNKEIRFICCSMKVTVYEREGFTEEVVDLGGKGPGQRPHKQIRRKGLVIIDGAPATKMVAVENRWGDADPFAIMKAETGAVGRALGMAGMLVAPGSGVATAEDLQEAQALEGTNLQGQSAAPKPEEAALPVERSAEELRAMVTEGVKKLESDYPDRYADFLAWNKERKHGKVSGLNLAALKGIVRKIEKEMEAGRKAAVEAAKAAPPAEEE